MPLSRAFKPVLLTTSRSRVQMPLSPPSAPTRRIDTGKHRGGRSGRKRGGRKARTRPDQDRREGTGPDQPAGRGRGTGWERETQNERRVANALALWLDDCNASADRLDVDNHVTVVRQGLTTPSASERIEAEHDIEHSHARRDRLGRYVPDLAALRTCKRLFCHVDPSLLLCHRRTMRGNLADLSGPGTENN